MSAPIAAFCCAAVMPLACMRAEGRTVPAIALGLRVGVNQRRPR
jgi:hypothetical protein